MSTSRISFSLLTALSVLCNSHFALAIGSESEPEDIDPAATAFSRLSLEKPDPLDISNIDQRFRDKITSYYQFYPEASPKEPHQLLSQESGIQVFLRQFRELSPSHQRAFFNVLHQEALVFLLPNSYHPLTKYPRIAEAVEKGSERQAIELSQSNDWAIFPGAWEAAEGGRDMLYYAPDEIVSCIRKFFEEHPDEGANNNSSTSGKEES